MNTNYTIDILQHALNEIGSEVLKARDMHSPMHGPHEGYATILEEVDELWDLVKAWHGSGWRHLSDDEKHFQDGLAKKDMRKEAIQIAAMAVRYILDVTE